MKQGEHIIDIRPLSGRDNVQEMLDAITKFHTTIMSNLQRNTEIIDRLNAKTKPKEYVTEICKLPQLYYRKQYVFVDDLPKQLNAYQGEVFNIHVSLIEHISELLIESIKQNKVAITHDLFDYNWEVIEYLLNRVNKPFTLTVNSVGLDVLEGGRDQVHVDDAKNVPDKITKIMGPHQFMETGTGDDIEWIWTWHTT